MLVALAPFWIAMAVVLLGCALALVVIGFVVDTLYLGLVIAPVHALLRAIGG